jgi:hypothetical protein
MDIFNIQSLIKQGKIVSTSEVDPNNSYLQIGVYQPNNRKAGSADANTYPPFAIPLSQVLSAGTTWGSITGLLSNQLDLQAALNNKYDVSNPAGYISAITSPMIVTALGYTPYDAVTNPAGYINITALAPYQPILGYTPENLANKSIDGTLAANSDTLYSSQKAVKTYVDGSVVGLLNDRGNWDASTNLFPTTGGSGPGGSILKGDLWYVSVAGTLGGTAVVVGNNFRALVNNPTLSTDWNILNVGLGYIPENIANKGIANGYASLDATGKVPSTQLQYKTLHTHGFNLSSNLSTTAGTRWTTFGALLMLGQAAPFTTNPTYAQAQRLGVIPKTGFIKSAKISWYVSGGNSTQNQIVTFRNNTTSTTYAVTSSLQIGGPSGAAKTFVVSGLNIPVTENDVVHTAIQFPAIISPATALTGIGMTIDYIIE